MAAEGPVFKEAGINLVYHLSGLYAIGHPSDTHAVWVTRSKDWKRVALGIMLRQLRVPRE